MTRFEFFILLLLFAFIAAMAFLLDQDPQKCRVSKTGKRSFVTRCYNVPDGYEVEVLD